MYIAIEGPDHCGKSTQCKLVSAALTASGIKNRVIREPGSTQLGDKIREALLDPYVPIDPLTELLLFMANRRQIEVQFIADHDPYEVIISDRCFISSVVYQLLYKEVAKLIYPKEYSLQQILEQYIDLHKRFCSQRYDEFGIPDMFIYLETHEDVIIDFKSQKEEIDRMDNEDSKTLIKLYDDVFGMLKKFDHTTVINIDTVEEKQKAVDDTAIVHRKEMAITKDIMLAILKRY
jgi:dTMP kinase